MTGPRDYTASEISELLAQRMDQLCEALHLKGPRQGHVLTPLNPTRGDRNPGSFVIQLSGSRAGRWSEYATDEHGDALDLVAYVQFGRADDRDARRQAFRWALRWLGLGHGEHLQHGTEKLERARADAEARRARAELEMAGMLEKKRRRAMAMWLGAKKLAAPGPGEKPSPAWRYFIEARGLPLEQMKRLPSAVKWTPAARHAESDQVVPAIVSGMFDAKGQLVAVHRIFLEPDGRGKLSPPPGWGSPAKFPAKKIWPAGYQGAFIPISRGRSDLPVAAAVEHGCVDEVFYCEGVEDGFTAALLAPEWRVYAVGAARNFEPQEPPACAGAVIVGKDNEKDRKVAQAVDAMVARFGDKCRDRGLGFYVTRAKGAKDFNDMVRGG